MLAIRILAVALLASEARAARPVLAGEGTYGVGEILVHYATAGGDAVPVEDANTNGVSDFVEAVATTADLALAHFRARGFRRPVADGGLGGDDRIDIYLRDLTAADGNAGTDSCSAGTCAGFAVSDNDFAGFAYPSRTEAIRSVVPHELFHLIQYAYAEDQPATWTEATAVWAVEELYGDQNSDFERFLASFVTRTYRPFERPVGGFGDGFVYGAALWPYFLEQRFGVELVGEAWTACAQARFLDAVGSALAAHDSSLDDAWSEFTRWNALTGSRAAGGRYPGAAGWPEAPREPVLDTTTATIYVEGLSARYVPLVLGARSQVALAPTNRIRVAGWLLADGAPFGDGLALAGDSLTVDAGRYTLVITGLSRDTITTAVDVTIGPPEDDPGGCATSSPPAAGVLGVALALRRARRRPGVR